jgi:hypothetical protein
VSRMSAMGWQARIGLAEGIAGACRWFVEHGHADTGVTR